MQNELFTYEADGQALIIHLPKELDHHNCRNLKYETDLLMEENYINKIVFVFKHGIYGQFRNRSLAEAGNKQMEGAGERSAYGAGPRITRILTIGGIMRLVKKCDTREEAIYG